MDRSPRELARQLYVDDLVYDRHTIEHLLKVFGADRVMAGTDFPFMIMDRHPDRRLDDLNLDAGTHRLLREGNALRWLGRAA